MKLRLRPASRACSEDLHQISRSRSAGSQLLAAAVIHTLLSLSHLEAKPETRPAPSWTQRTTLSCCCPRAIVCLQRSPPSPVSPIPFLHSQHPRVGLSLVPSLLTRWSWPLMCLSGPQHSHLRSGFLFLKYQGSLMAQLETSR